MNRMDDLISRQAAIEAIGGNKAVGDPSQMDEDEVIKMWERIRIINVLNHLPSAEPEIIQCKDCKHKVIENDVWTCPFGLPGGPEFFCGYGAERRTDA